jgi:PleD family two-component response regulator
MRTNTSTDIINAGANDFVKKPIDIAELEAKIVRCISERDLKRELSRLSMTDSLTGLFNQRQFYMRLREEIVRSTRQKHPLALILLDLDNFRVQRQARPPCGDQALRDGKGDSAEHPRRRRFRLPVWGTSLRSFSLIPIF